MIFGGRLRAGLFGGSVVRDETHCWVSETTPSCPGSGVWLFLMALIPRDIVLRPVGLQVWVGVGVCCLRTAQWTRASLIVCECKCVRAHGGCLGTKSR